MFFKNDAIACAYVGLAAIQSVCRDCISLLKSSDLTIEMVYGMLTNTDVCTLTFGDEKYQVSRLNGCSNLPLYICFISEYKVCSCLLFFS